MKITLEIPDEVSDILSVTCIGSRNGYNNVTFFAIPITNHDGETYVISDNDNIKSYWKSECKKVIQ